MKTFLSATIGFLWMTLISIGCCYSLLWIAPYCFFSTWWGLILFLIFGTWLFQMVWNAIAPLAAITPVVYLSYISKIMRPTYLCASIPGFLVGAYCIFTFWSSTADTIFSIKDWISAIVWTYVAGSCFYHLSWGFLTLFFDSDTPEETAI